MNSSGICSIQSNTKYQQMRYALFMGTVILMSADSKIQGNYQQIQSEVVAPVFSKTENALKSDTFLDIKMIENLNKISNMAKFEADWNGRGASPFSNKAIDLFSDILQNLARQPDIAPTGRNSLLMQYTNGADILAFEVMEDKTEQVLVKNGNYKEAITDVIIENVYDIINKKVNSFYEPISC